MNVRTKGSYERVFVWPLIDCLDERNAFLLVELGNYCERVVLNVLFNVTLSKWQLNKDWELPLKQAPRWRQSRD